MIYFYQVEIRNITYKIYSKSKNYLNYLHVLNKLENNPNDKNFILNTVYILVNPQLIVTRVEQARNVRRVTFNTLGSVERLVLDLRKIIYGEGFSIIIVNAIYTNSWCGLNAFFEYHRDEQK